MKRRFFSMEVGGEQIVSYLPDEEGYFPVGDLCARRSSPARIL